MQEMEIGKIVNTHGLRGHVKVEPWCDGIETFEYLDSIFIKGTEYNIESVKPHKNIFLLKLENIDDINVAEGLKGAVITADREKLPPLPEGTYYITDIIGLEVYEDEKYIGKISDWIETGSNNVYIIKRSKGKDVLIPAIDDVIKKIDIENKTMSVKLLEGLMEDDD